MLTSKCQNSNISKGDIAYMKNVVRLCIMLLIPAIAAAYLFYALETYDRVVHSDVSASVSLAALLCAFIEFILWRKSRKQHKACTIIALFAAVILIGVLYIARKIPFCVECDQVTADDLGFLTHWITPMERK